MTNEQKAARARELAASFAQAASYFDDGGVGSPVDEAAEARTEYLDAASFLTEYADLLGRQSELGPLLQELAAARATIDNVISALGDSYSPELSIFGNVQALVNRSQDDRAKLRLVDTSNTGE